MPFDDAFEDHMALERLMVGAANTKEIVTQVASLRDLPNTLKTEMSNLARTQARNIGAVLYSIADQAELDDEYGDIRADPHAHGS